MLNYIIKRLFMMIPVLLGVTLLVFGLLHMAPGDPAAMVLGPDAEPEMMEKFNHEHYLDRPFLEQYFRYVLGLLHGEMGNSYKNGRSVSTVLFERIGNTIQLGLSGVLLMLLIGIPLGIISAVKQYTILDNIAQVVGMIGVSLPAFWLALILIRKFALDLRWLPASGWYGPTYKILPALTLGITGAANMMRTTRSSMLDVVRQDYIDTARAKGQSEIKVITHHMLRNAMLPIITVAGNRIGRILGTGVAVESIFSIPGTSKLMIDSIYMRDYPIVQGAILLLAIMCSIINLVTDLIYAFVDPRMMSRVKSTNSIIRKKGQGKK